jgi:hypothetical protein
MKKVGFFTALIIAFFILQIQAESIVPRIYIRPITYKGSSQMSAQQIVRIITDRIVKICAPEITDSENKADYALSISYEGNPGEYVLFLEANGILKRTSSEADISLMIQDAVDYLMTNLLPVQTFFQENDPFFSGDKTATGSSDEPIDRERKSVRQAGNLFLTPIMDNIFKLYPFQLQFLGGATIPIMTGDASTPVSFHLAIPFNYYFYTIQLFAFSLFGQVNYNLIYKKVAADKNNNLHVLSFDVGASAVFTLPFLREMSLHLNLGIGYAGSYFASTQFVGTIYTSWDPCLHPSFEVEYSLNDYLSLSVWCSYMWVIYLRDNVQSIQTGVSLGYRF